MTLTATDTRRRCASCDAILRSTNRADVCSPCERSAREAELEALRREYEREAAVAIPALTERIVEVLERGPMAASQVASALGVSEYRVRGILAHLRRAGRVAPIRSKGVRMWTLAEDRAA